MRTSKITREQALEFRKEPALLEKGGVGEDMIYTVCSHGYGSIQCKEKVQGQTLRGRMLQRCHKDRS